MPHIEPTAYIDIRIIAQKRLNFFDVIVEFSGGKFVLWIASLKLRVHRNHVTGFGACKRIGVVRKTHSPIDFPGKSFASLAPVILLVVLARQMPGKRLSVDVSGLRRLAVSEAPGAAAAVRVCRPPGFDDVGLAVHLHPERLAQAHDLAVQSLAQLAHARLPAHPLLAPHHPAGLVGLQGPLPVGRHHFGLSDALAPVGGRIVDHLLDALAQNPNIHPTPDGAFDLAAQQVTRVLVDAFDHLGGVLARPLRRGVEGLLVDEMMLSQQKTAVIHHCRRADRLCN